MSSSFLSRSDVALVGGAVVIIVIAIAISAAVQGPSISLSQIITVGPVWNGDSWTCTSDANFMVFGTLRGLAADSQIAINVSGIGTQSFYTLEPTQIESFSIGASADRSIIITRTGTVTGFITLQTTSDAIASCIIS